MSEELQGLLEKIHEEGIEKAAAEKDKILADAAREAETIVKTAKTEAEAIVKAAREEAEKSEKRAQATIRQAARDIILALKTELLERMR